MVRLFYFSHIHPLQHPQEISGSTHFCVRAIECHRRRIMSKGWAHAGRANLHDTVHTPFARVDRHHASIKLYYSLRMSLNFLRACMPCNMNTMTFFSRKKKTSPPRTGAASRTVTPPVPCSQPQPSFITLPCLPHP